MAAGYSGKQLAKKLSLRDGQRVWFDGMPEHVIDEIDEYALELTFVAAPEDAPDAAHIFVTDRAEMAEKLTVLRESMAKDGHVWVSWPKQTSGNETDLTEDTIREVALPMGLVDTKVCAVDDTWSALKLVIRKDLR